MSSYNELCKKFKFTYDQDVATRDSWRRLAGACISKAVLGQIYASGLNSHFKEQEMPGYNSLALTDAVVATAGLLHAASVVEQTAEATRNMAAYYNGPIPEWALRPQLEEE